MKDKQGKLLYGSVTKDDAMYIWKAETGACEKCKAMDGKVFDDANEIPDRPHPNCKCWIDIQKKETSDPIQQHRDEINEQKALELEFQKLQGDLKCLENECKQIEKLTDEKIEIINDIQTNYKLINTEAETLKDIKSEFQNSKKDIQQTTSRIIQMYPEINKQIDKNTSCPNCGGTIKAISKFEMEISAIKTKIDDFFVNIAGAQNTSIVAKLYQFVFDTPEAYNLLMIGLDSKTYNKNYISKNGKVYNNLYELEYKDLQEEIKKRLSIEKEKQNMQDIKIVYMKESSSISKKIIQSESFKKFFVENLTNIMNNKMPQTSEIIFESCDKDLYGAIHSGAVKNVLLDEHNNLHFEIHDYYNFNPNRTSVKGRVGYKLQKQGAIKPYYIIIKVVIPYNIIDLYIRDEFKYVI